MSKMSVQDALSELKIITSRISKEASASFIGMQQANKPISGRYTKDEIVTQIKSSYDALTALVGRKKAIKAAIVQSNATTRVKIGDHEMTVAEAIEYKNSISLEQDILNVWKTQLSFAVKSVEQQNALVNANLQKLLENNFSKDTKVNAEDIKGITDPYLKANEWAIIDPIDLKAKIDALEMKITEFKGKVDSVLTTSNVQTLIEVHD